ncbi:MAG: response regulator transcription factor [Planctomycetales bacterium]|nr:response regulator transcription factor [Planctomycetales bacterium]
METQTAPLAIDYYDVTSEQIYIVDDHPSDMLVIQRLCESMGIPVQVFADPAIFLASISPNAIGCLIVDLMMPSLSGIELHQKLRQRNIDLTTVVVTGYADAGSCRAGFQSGVFDFIEKDFKPASFLEVIRRALSENRRVVADRRHREVKKQRLSTLTDREMDVARLLADGATLKEIGSQLGISVQTASKHRLSVFSKLDVPHEVELFRSFRDSFLRVESRHH